MSKEWYDKHHKEKETEEFNDFWMRFYDSCTYDDPDEEDEYWIRKGFALIGWSAHNDMG